MKKLVLAEKPSVGKDIARVLKCNQKHNGYYEGQDYIVTWALGHLVTLSGPGQYDMKYENWHLEDLPIIPDHFLTMVIPQSSKQYRTVKAQMLRKDVSGIIIATDAGREGELVARWILQKVKPKKPLERLWISSVTDGGIKKGFESLKPAKAYEGLFRAAVARAEGDWVVGINGTRALTTKHNTPLSCGRVQTPTLALIAQRDEQIRNFRPKKYYGLEGSYQGLAFHLLIKDQEKTTFDEKLLDEIKSKLELETRVKSITKKNKNKKAQNLYDLTSLQKDAFDRFGYSPKFTLDLMQKLYEYHKALTYPRTDSKYLTEDIYPTLKDRLRVIQGDPYRAVAHRLIKSPIKKSKAYINDAKVSDHHAIIPTESPVNVQDFSYDERRIYDLVVGRFLENLMADYTYAETKVEIESAGYVLVAKGHQVIDPGFRELSTEVRKDQNLPMFKEGQILKLNAYNKTQGETSPPSLFNQGSLLTAMENPGKFMAGSQDLKKVLEKTGGLGTVATRGDIIEKLFNTQVIELKGKAIHITKKGRQLLQVAPEALKSPKLTAEWELKLDQIANNKLSADAFVNEMKAYTRQIVEQIKGSSQTFKHDNVSTTPCPECGKKMLLREGRHGQSLVCPDRNCNHRISLSRVTNARCPECKKKLVLRGSGPDKVFTCKCGFKEKLSTFEKKKKEGLKKGGKKDFIQYKKQQEKEAKAQSEKNNPFAALGQLKIDK